MKRIDELITACETTVTEYYDGRGNVTSTIFDRKKFMKLVAAECFDFAKDNGGLSSVADYKALMKHLGI